MIQKLKPLLMLAWVSVAVSGCFGSSGEPRQRKAHLAAARPGAWAQIQRVVVIVLENTDYEDTIHQPYLSQLAQKGALLTSYYAITHPSQPNYIAMVAGQTHGVSDNDKVDLDAQHIGDLLEKGGKSWKSYAEGFPGNCFKGSQAGAYYRKHNPLISFKNVSKNPTRCANIVNEAQFKSDLASKNLPNFSLYIPDANNDGHDTGIGFADRWLSKFMGDIDAETLSNTLFVVTFDEGSGGRNNRIVTIFYGAGVQPGASSNQDYDHYCLLRTIEDIFSVGTLGQYDESAVPIDDIWK